MGIVDNTIVDRTFSAEDDKKNDFAGRPAGKILIGLPTKMKHAGVGCGASSPNRWYAYGGKATQNQGVDDRVFRIKPGSSGPRMFIARELQQAFFRPIP
jgi:hypothetical protein